MEMSENCSPKQLPFPIYLNRSFPHKTRPLKVYKEEKICHPAEETNFQMKNQTIGDNNMNKLYFALILISGILLQTVNGGIHSKEETSSTVQQEEISHSTKKNNSKSFKVNLYNKNTWLSFSESENFNLSLNDYCKPLELSGGKFQNKIKKICFCGPEGPCSLEGTTFNGIEWANENLEIDLTYVKNNSIDWKNLTVAMNEYKSRHGQYPKVIYRPSYYGKIFNVKKIFKPKKKKS